MNIETEYKYIQSNIFIVSAAYLFKSFNIYLFRQRDCKKFLPLGSLQLFFVSSSQWIRNKQLFKVGLVFDRLLTYVDFDIYFTMQLINYPSICEFSVDDKG